MADERGRGAGQGAGARGGLRPTAAAATALALVLVSGTWMNTTVFPLFDPIFTYARDISVTFNAGALIALGYVAYRAPRLLAPGPFVAAAIGFQVVGAVGLAAGLALGGGALLTAGASLGAIGRAGAIVMAGLMLSRLEARGMAVAVCAAFTAQYLATSCAFAIPVGLGVTCFLAFPVITAALARRATEEVLGPASRREAPSDLSVTRPASFLAPFSALFVCLFLFQVAFGFALRFDEVGGAPHESPLSWLPVLLVALWVCAGRRPFPADFLVQTSALAVIAGFLLSSEGTAAYAAGATLLLHAGNALFGMTSRLALASIAARNPLAAATTLAWGGGVSSLGSLVGAAAGVGANQAVGHSPGAAFAVSATLLLVFAAYVIFGLRGFTFSGVIEGIQPVGERDAAGSPAERLEERCGELAAAFGLTPREAEVFAMLARGRDRAYIEDALVVSRNTVKAHVKHIYAKLGIHSHQELIDLVEG